MIEDSMKSWVTPAWWLSSILGALVLNVLSNLVSGPVQVWLARISASQRAKNTKRASERAVRVARLAKQPRLRQLLLARQIRLGVIAFFFTAGGLSMMGTGLWLQSLGPPRSIHETALGIAGVILLSVALTVGRQMFDDASDLSRSLEAPSSELGGENPL